VSELAREVRRLALPAIVTSLLQTMVFVVDRIMLGHHSSASLAAMQIGGLLEWSAFALFLSFEVGILARVGFQVGAREFSRARAAAIASLIAAVVFGAVMVLAAPLILATLPLYAPEASMETLAGAREYLSVTLTASPVVFLALGAVAILQAGGDTRTPLAIGAFSNVVHVGLNRWLILGGWGVTAMGIRGCAWSTVVTFSLEAILGLAVLSRRTSRGPVSLRGTMPPIGMWTEEARAVVRVAGPALVERMLYQTGFLAYGAMIALLGDASMAAAQVLVGVESVCFLSADAYGVAAAALVAQKLGAKRRDQAARTIRIGVRDAVVILTLLGLVFAAGRWQVIPLFTSDMQVVTLCASTLPILAVAQPFMATALVMAQALRGAGYTREVLVISALGTLAVRLSATWLFSIRLHLGLPGVVMGSTADWITRSTLLVLLGRAKMRA
jgi:putative MATE family efflux protein